MPKLLDLKQALARSMAVPEYQVDELLNRTTPVIILDDLVSRAPPLDRPCALAAFQAGAAAQYSQIQLLNPPGSGVIATVNSIAMRLESANEFVIGFYDTALPTTKAVRYTDRRLIPQQPACQGWADDGASKVVGAVSQIFFMDAVNANWNPTANGMAPITLDEDQGLVIECTVVDIDLYANFYWTERPKTLSD